MIDNYDSFVYNLVQYIGELGEEVLVKRNDEITIDEIKELMESRAQKGKKDKYYNSRNKLWKGA